MHFIDERVDSVVFTYGKWYLIGLFAFICLLLVASTIYAMVTLF